MLSARLSMMMFLQFFIWGSWYVTAAIYFGSIGFTASDIGNTYSVGPLAAIVSPLLLGMLADRFFPAQIVLGILHFGAGAAMLGAAAASQSADLSPGLVNGLLLLHMLFFMPTLGLINTISFAHLDRTERQFPLIRVFGTIGWIVAGVFVSRLLAADATVLPLQIAAGGSFALGLYAFTLPHTAPKGKGGKVSVRDLFGFDALGLMKDRSFAVFMLCSFLICIPLSFYYAFTAQFINEAGIADPGFKMTFGQMSEILFMVVMPFFFVRLGVRKMLLVGMLAWVIRYALFALGASPMVTWMLMGGIVLHGICYDFFFVTGQVYVDRRAPAKIRGAAQGLLVLCTLGLGMLIGAQVAGMVKTHFTPQLAGSLEYWQSVWLVPAVLALVVALVFGMFFKEQPGAVSPGERS